MAHDTTTRDECGEATEVTCMVLGKEAKVLVDWAVIRKGTVVQHFQRDTVGDTRYSHLSVVRTFSIDLPKVTERPEIELTRVVFEDLPSDRPQLYGNCGRGIYDLREAMTKQEAEQCLEALHEAIEADYYATEDLFYEMKVYWKEEEVVR